jgi:hypothetical protein
MPKTNTQSKSKQPIPPKKNKFLIVVWFVLVLIAIGFLLRPGVYTIQPVDAIPEGTTIVYMLRDAQTPFYTSLHPECFYSPTSVSLICNAMVKTALTDLSGRIILRLPYNHSAYLKGSNGIEPGYIED